MDVRYRFESLKIDGFRGIKSLHIDLPSKAPLYVIGANNAGKSTVINALALALRGGGFHTFVPERYDFYQESSGRFVDEFNIDLSLTSDGGALPAVQGVGNPIDVHGLRVIGSVDRRGRMAHRHVLVDGTDAIITYSPRTAIKGTTKERYQGQGLGWTPRYARPDEIREALPDVWLLTPENLNRSLYQWKTGPLSKLSELLSNRFLTENWEFEYEGKKRRMPKALESVHAFFRQAVGEFPFWKTELRPRLEDALSRYVGRQAAVRLRPDIQTIEQWLTQQLAAAFAADAGGAVTPLERMGDGWQALVRVAALDVLRNYPEVVGERTALLCEEPETFLHPHLRRRLRGILEDLACEGWLVVAATHSSEFVKFGSGQQIQRLWREGEQVTAASLSVATVAQSAQLQEKLEERGNHEFLFASKAIFLEGKDDLFATRVGLEKLKVDLDGRSISLVSVGGIENMPDYVSIAKQLQIPWCVVTDEDLQADGSIKPRTQEIRAILMSASTLADRQVVWKGSLESTLKKSTGKALPKWQSENVEPQTLERLRNELPDYVAVCDEIAAWITN